MPKGKRKRGDNIFLTHGRSPGRGRKSLIAAAALMEVRFAHERTVISCEFDVNFYRRQLPETAQALDPVIHYLESGWRDLLDPSPEFSTAYYLDTNPDVKDRRVNPFVHYIEFGRDEGRKPRPPQEENQPERADSYPFQSRGFVHERAVIAAEFAIEFYWGQFPTIPDPAIDPILHYLESGWRELRDPCPDFSTAYYLERNPDVRESGVNPFVHYIEFGRNEGRLPRPPADDNSPAAAASPGIPGRRYAHERSTIEAEFDLEFYRAQLPGSLDPAIDPIVHYLESGWRELRDPCPAFSTAYYLDRNPDVRESGVNPFVHYVEFGRQEGRQPKLEIERLPSADPPLYFSGDRLAREWTVIAAAFDVDFYLQRSPDLQGAPIDPIMHYLEAGWRELRDPSPEFSTAYYLQTNPAIRERGINPFVHYIEFGRKEGRKSRPPANETAAATTPASGAGRGKFARERAIIADAFDISFYLQRSPDLQGASVDPIVHYLEAGWRELRDPSPEFSTAHYLDTNPEIREGGVNPFVHYIEFGRKEGRTGRPPVNETAPATATATEPADGRFARERAVIADAFDAAFYLERSPDLQGSSVDPIMHYLEAGWRELRDPCRDFSTGYYLEANPDIRAGGINPFVHYIEHGIREGRAALPFSVRKLRRDYQPLITAIVPNFNHARFLEHRLDSILGQTYKNLEVLILDDCSTDDSVEVIKRYQQNHSDRVRTILNASNSGNVFSQWRKGLENATGDLIWICESDDFCEPDFLEHCLRPFADSSVMISFGRVQFADELGHYREGLDAYRERAEPGIWSSEITRPASEWFRRGFGVSNLIPNVGGCLIRRQPISEQIWADALTYRICGDWYLYSILSNGGQMSYVPTAVTYFRQHGKNTSVTGFRRPHYYSEHEKVMTALRCRWGTPYEVVMRFFANVLQTYHYSKAMHSVGKITDHFSMDRVISTERNSRHILVAILGFQLGGGEIIPIHLANELVRGGNIVSVLCLDSQREILLIRRQLDSRIAVYESDYVAEVGLEKFMTAAGIDVVHSHYVGIEFFFFDKRRRFPSNIPYVVTLHGSYECTAVPEETLLRIIRGVSHWCYLSHKNLQHLEGRALNVDSVSAVGNAMPIDQRAFPHSRESLGIESDDLLFTLASRAIPEKGWRVAIAALRQAQGRTDRKMHLMLCGAGPEDDALRAEFGNDPRVHFMGFQEQIHGAYRQSDVAILPTRFAGESFPMAVVQALQVGTPVIATDVGEVRRIMMSGELCAGVIVPRDDDDVKFIESVAQAMLKMANVGYRAACAADARKLGLTYDMQKVAARYVEIYDSCAAQIAAQPPVGAEA